LSTTVQNVNATMAKPHKLKARLPHGLADRGPAEIAATRTMVETIRATFERYGFEPVETPAIEYTDALGKFLPDLDRPNEGVFSFQDDDDQWLSLRYDLTAPLARYVAQNFQNLALPYRSYRFGWVFRNEKPGPGRFRQFMQFDADTVGAATMAADAEMCMLAADTIEALGIPRGSYVVKVNNRKVLDGIMDSIGLGGNDNAGKRLIVLRAIDKLDRLGPDGVRQLLGKGRKDESGDFTKGAELEEPAVDAVLGFLTNDANNVDETFARVESLVSGSDQGLDGVNELRGIADLIAAGGYDDGRVRIDTSVVRGLEYYTGPVFEVELTFEIKDEKGRGDRLLHRRLAPAGGAHRARQDLVQARARPRRGHRVRPRPRRRLPAHGVGPAQCRHPRRALSRQPEELRQPAQIRRQARLALRRHPGRRREEQSCRPAGHSQGPDPRRRDRRPVEGARRLLEKTGRGAVRGARREARRRRARPARAPRPPSRLKFKIHSPDCHGTLRALRLLWCAAQCSVR
jgi:histidyl-tRNA synthetase